MALFGKKKQPDHTVPTQPDMQQEIYDDLESITADLPGEEQTTQEVPFTEEHEAPIHRSRPYHTAEEPRSTQKKAHKEKGTKQDEAARVPKRFRTIVQWAISGLLIFGIIFMVLSNFADVELLGIRPFEVPAKLISGFVTPLQNGFTSLTSFAADYFSSLKLRSALEEAYNQVVAENEELTYKALLADELQIQLSQFENMSDEVNVNLAMNPIVCRVIGRNDGNYFSTFTINRGSRDGIEEYMAVTINGALVGYTEKVSASESTVRTIIDSEASIAGLVQSSRDQGTVRGTLGIDGTALCRMYYLPDNSIPRPGDTVVSSGVGMSFPKGIPIGTVRESTRGMDSNKSYVVVEPLVDFQHIEYVIVLRYKPTAQAVQGSSNVSSYIQLIATETARPYPTLRMFSSSFYSATPSPVPEDYVEEVATPEPTMTATPSPTLTPIPIPRDTSPVLEYQVVSTAEATSTIAPTPTPTPAPTPSITIDPSSLTFEEDD